MKKILALITVLILMISVSCSASIAQERPSNVISTDVLAFVQNVINVRHEKVLTSQWSVYISPRSVVGETPGACLLAGARRYIAAAAPQGLFLDISGVYASTTGGALTGRVSGFGGGFGYKHLVANRLILEGTFEVKYISTTASWWIYSVAERGTVATGSFSIGYTF